MKHEDPQGEGRIRARDEKEDRGMLDDSEEVLGPARRQCMVDGRGEVKQYGSRGKHAASDDFSRTPMPRRIHDEKRGSDQHGGQCNAVADAVREFFTPRLLARGACDRFAHVSFFFGMRFDVSR